MAWCFNTRTSVATVLNTHPSISSCLWVLAALIPDNCAEIGLMQANLDPPPPSLCRFNSLASRKYSCYKMILHIFQKQVFTYRLVLRKHACKCSIFCTIPWHWNGTCIQITVILPASWLFVQHFLQLASKKTSKLPTTGPLWGESTSACWILFRKGQRS